MLNQCTFEGRLTRKPELRHTSSDHSFTSFSLAVDRDRPERDNTWVADFIDFVAWNKVAEKVCKYDKGDLLIVSGRMRNQTRTDKDGKTSIVAEISVEYCHKINIIKRTVLPSYDVDFASENVEYPQI